LQLALKRAMHIPTSAFLITEPLPAIRKKLRTAAWACAAIAATILAVHLLTCLPEVHHWFALLGWQTMPAAAEIMIAVALLCLASALPNRALADLRLCQGTAALLILLCFSNLVGSGARAQSWMHGLTGQATDRSLFGWTPVEFALAFLLFGVVLLVEPAKSKAWVRVGDCVAMAMSATTLHLVFAAFIVRMGIFGSPALPPGTPAPVVCLFLLSATAVLRRTDRGVFSIFLGSGIGSRIARYLCPLVLVIPFLRETTRARILSSGRIPQLSATAGLAALASVIAMGLVLFLAWRIAAMESQIRVLTLRDGLTGLYNLRGLTLLGEQALQLARRADLPFSVLYIDIDNLKHVNDTQGHAAGSELLRETSELLVATFRETDIVSRVGGDEFVVAGQFSEEMLGLAVRRLGELCSRRNREPGRMYGIGFSIGQVTAHGDDLESLEELLIRSDRAMYETKRKKKARLANHAETAMPQPRPQPAPSLE
jgi:diguanylate cyclase (GGDEF)-like protein